MAIQTKETKKRIQACLDGARSLYRGDDGYYAENLVNQTLAEVYRLEYPALGWASGDLLDFKQGVDPGAYSYDYLQAGSVGRAKFIAPNASDITKADVSVERSQRSIQTLAHSFSFSTLDLRSSAMIAKQGLDFDLPALLADACRLGHDMELNDTIAFGNEGLGLFGITNQPGITVQAAVTGDWLNPATTADQIYADLVSAWTQMKSLTKGVEKPDTLVVSSAVMGRLMTTFLNTANGSNISLQIAIEMNLKLAVMEEETMAIASASGEQAALMYKREPSKVFVVMPLYLAPQEPQKLNLNMTTIIESRFGGVSAPKPLSILRLDGI